MDWYSNEESLQRTLFSLLLSSLVAAAATAARAATVLLCTWLPLLLAAELTGGEGLEVLIWDVELKRVPEFAGLGLGVMPPVLFGILLGSEVSIGSS